MSQAKNWHHREGNRAPRSKVAFRRRKGNPAGVNFRRLSRKLTVVELFLAQPLRRHERPFSMRRIRLPIILDRSKFGEEPINAENHDV
jgi:hypothetical protein